MVTVELSRAHAGPVVSGHPWVFAQAIQRVHGAPEAGDEVRVTSAEGRPLGRGFWSPASAIPVRLLTRDPDRALDRAFFAERIDAAVALRSLLGLPSGETSGFRLVNAEGDGLPGLVVDRYEHTLVVQLGTVGLQRRKQLVVSVLAERTAAAHLVEVTNKSAQQREGFHASPGPLLGDAPERLHFHERGLVFSLPAGSLQKTGYYFDQREHRAMVEGLAVGRDVLDVCCYLGGFALAAARGGARSVTAIDSSQPALEVAAALARDNALDTVDWVRADAKAALTARAARGERFDLVVLDPPKLVPTARHLDRGRRAYRLLNRHALALVRPGGLLVTCSCSAAMTELDFLRMLSIASRDAEREVAVLRVGRQGPDHPVPAGFAEGSYLKTVLAVVR